MNIFWCVKDSLEASDSATPRERSEITDNHFSNKTRTKTMIFHTKMIERHKKDIWKICIWYLGRNENHQADVSKTVVKSWPALGEVVADDPVYISYDRFDLWSLTIIYTFLPGFQEFFSIFMIPENLALHAPEIALIYSVLWQICIVCPLIVRDPRFNKSHVTSLLIQ